jgi:uncharacterized membrane protein
MRSKLNIAGHPLHPMLVSLPVACALIALVSDIVAASSQNPFWYFMGYVLAIGAWATGLVAAVPGLADYFFVIPSRSLAKRHATIHLILNLSVIALFVASWLAKNSAGGSRIPSDSIASSLTVPLILEIIAALALVTSGWYGWTLVYKDHLGTDDEIPASRDERRVA